MKRYDEYQKLMRYKYGSHSFMIIITLMLINFLFSLFYNIQWAETKEIEYILLMFVAILYSVVMYVYHGAYFNKRQNAKFYVVFFFILGLFQIFLSFSQHSPPLFTSDGRVTSDIIPPASGLLWLALSITYFVRLLVEKKRDAKDNIEEDNND